MAFNVEKNPYHLKDFDIWDIIVKVEPRRYTREHNFVTSFFDTGLGESTEQVDTSYIGKPHILLDVVNGLAYVTPMYKKGSYEAGLYNVDDFMKTESGDPLIKEIDLALYGDGWALFELPMGLTWERLNYPHPNSIYPDQYPLDKTDDDDGTDPDQLSLFPDEK